jgi:hypothetical protein
MLTPEQRLILRSRIVGAEKDRDQEATGLLFDELMSARDEIASIARSLERIADTLGRG